FSPRVKDVISYSREEALRLRHDYIGTEHLLLGLIREGDGVAIKILKNIGDDIGSIRQSTEDAVKGSSMSRARIGNMPLTKQYEKILKITYMEAKIFKSDVNGTEHLILESLREEENIASQVIQKYNITYDMFQREVARENTTICDEALSTSTKDEDCAD